MLITSKLAPIALLIQEFRIVEMKFSPFRVRVVDAGPLPPDNKEALKKPIKKVAMRKLRQMQYEAQRKAS